MTAASETTVSGTAVSGAKRRVLLLETDERSGLVAAIANACQERDVSLEITTGAGHVLITFAADDEGVEALRNVFLNIPGVAGVHPYTVK